MSNAIMCDRCGKCFNPLSETGSMCRFRNPIFQDPADIQNNRIGSKLLHDKSSDACVDLCPDCTAQFFIFMNPGKERADTDRDKDPLKPLLDYDRLVDIFKFKEWDDDD